VSIKNKLVTAVTTAGLLAGLFGSAFVPAVRAAAGDQTYSMTCTGSDKTTNFTANTAFTGGKCWFTAAKSPTFVITMTDAGGDDSLPIEFTVTNATIKSVAVAGTGTNSVATNSTSGATKATFTAAVDAGETMIMTVVLYPVAAGTTVTVTADADLDPSIDGTSFSLVSIASAAASVPAVGTGLSTAAVGTNVTQNAALTEYLMDYDAVGLVEVAVENTYGDAITTSVVTATVSGITGMGVAITADDANCAGAAPPTAYDSSWSAVSGTGGIVSVCLRRVDATDTTVNGLGTLTITAGGVVIKTTPLRVYGTATKIAVTQYANSIAAGVEWGGTSSVDAIGKMVYTDAYGTVLPRVTVDDGGYDALDDALSFTNAAGTTLTSVDAGDANTTAATEVDAFLSFTNTFCTTALAGTDITVTAKLTNASLTVVSTSFVVSCTGAAIKITGITAAKSVVTPGEDFWIDLTAVDVNGKASGFGATEIALPAGGLQLSPATGSAATEISDDDGSALAVADFGAGSWGIVDGAGAVKVQAPTTPGTYTLVLTYSDIDATVTGSTAGTYTMTVVVRNVNVASKTDLTAGPKKKIATADFGPGAGNLKVAFVLENASGVTKTFYRKANASGVAKYTIALRGTWTVYATFGDNITDTVTLRK